MKRVLITGVTGFVGRHLAAHCDERGDAVAGVGRRAPGEGDPPETLSGYVELDLLDGAGVSRLIADDPPDWIFHLAGESSVRESWDRPQRAIDANVVGTSNVLEAAREHAPETRVLVACSGDEYGAVSADELPLREERALRPQNPYAVSKACADLLAGFFADAHGLHVIRTRAFNHTGPGQSDRFAIPSFARQIAEASAAGKREIELRTGNLEVRRDFTDVRDVVRAYRLLLDRAAPDTYNVCSGRSVELREVVRRLAEQAGVEVATRVDPERLRDGEVMDAYGSPDRLRAATGWEPEIGIDRTVADVLSWWRDRIGVQAHG